MMNPAYNGYIDIVKILVNNNADINAHMVLENSEPPPLGSISPGSNKNTKLLN